MAACARFAIPPGHWENLARPIKLDLLAYETGRREMLQELLTDWPKDDWGRNLAVLLAALD